MMPQTIAWLYLLGAAGCETAWFFSLKAIRADRLRALWRAQVTISSDMAATLLPVGGYIAFGLLNVYLFAVAARQIPSATAFAVWMALSLVFIKVVDLWLSHGSWSLPELFFLLLIVVGIIGLKTYATP